MQQYCAYTALQKQEGINKQKISALAERNCNRYLGSRPGLNIFNPGLCVI